jgi:GDP-L-fucose synthase
MKINKNSKIFLAGHNGMVGSAIFRKLINNNYKNIITKTREELDLTNQKKVLDFLKKEKPYFVILAAAKVGGINANMRYKDQFLYQNLQIQNNIIYGSFLAGIKNLFFLGSSCIYPKNCPQPMKESDLLTGKLEETNESYAIAKIAGIKMCENLSQIHKLNYKSFMPPNLYGPNDNYDLENSHFYPALLKKIIIAKKKNKKEIVVWGNGKAKRELMFVDDFANAIIFFMKKEIKESFINIGIGKDFSINWYLKFLMKKMNAKIKIKYDLSKPNGMMRKCLDIKLARSYGWKSQNDLHKGFEITLKDLLKKIALQD